jgi:serine/threonine protein kinase
MDSSGTNGNRRRGSSAGPGASSGADAGVAGTDGYMSPEAGPVDIRRDVYALGGILRDLLPPAASGPKPLRSVVNRAMADNPSDRYPDASALAHDVRRYAAGTRVDAHRETPLERTARLLRTYKTPIALVLAYVIMRVLLLLWSR